MRLGERRLTAELRGRGSWRQQRYREENAAHQSTRAPDPSIT
jgi:hypothetical protein